MTVHHVAIVTSDVARSLRFWRDGLGLAKLMDQTFTGDWPTLFGARSDVLRSVFLGDPASADACIVELVVFDDVQGQPRKVGTPGFGLFLLSLNRDVDDTLDKLAELGFDDGVRRITMPSPEGRTVQMAVITAPDGVLVELIGAAE
jgi:catechol 2,3-dioxygenase-like lactoylglutathione lyase family enzyme